MRATKSDLRATDDELKVAKEGRSEAEKVATMEKNQNYLLTFELDQVTKTKLDRAKAELIDYKVEEEEW